MIQSRKFNDQLCTPCCTPLLDTVLAVPQRTSGTLYFVLRSSAHSLQLVLLVLYNATLKLHPLQFTGDTTQDTALEQAIKSDCIIQILPHLLPRLNQPIWVMIWLCTCVLMQCVVPCCHSRGNVQLRSESRLGCGHWRAVVKVQRLCYGKITTTVVPVVNIETIIQNKGKIHNAVCGVEQK